MRWSWIDRSLKYATVYKTYETIWIRLLSKKTDFDLDDIFSTSLVTKKHRNERYSWKKVCEIYTEDIVFGFIDGAPQGALKSRFHAGFLHKSRQEIAWNSCSRQVYPITLDARLIFHEITQLFSSNSRFHGLKYVESRHHAFPLGGTLMKSSCNFEYFASLSPNCLNLQIL